MVDDGKQKENEDPNLLKTYIDKIDEIIGGGIPKHFSFLISGEPGTMKTTLATWILYHNLLHNKIKNGFYVLFDQDSNIFEEQMSGIGLDLAGFSDGIFDIIPISIETNFLLNDQGKNRFVKSYKKNLSGRRLSLIDLILKTLGRETDYEEDIKDIPNWEKYRTSYKNSILVIDSLSVLSDIYKLDENRDLLLALMNKLKEIGFTTIYLTEMNLKNEYAPEKYLCDGIIILEHRDKMETGTKNALTKGGKYADSFTKTIKCEKMRTKKINTGYFSFEFINGKFIFESYDRIL